jgi:hypothetical protein
MLTNAGISIQFSLHMTTLAPAQLQLGTIGSMASYYYNQPWYGWLNPMQYLVNSAHDGLYFWLNYQVLSYTHYLQFSNTTLFNAMAYTGPNNQTTINPQSMGIKWVGSLC